MASRSMLYFPKSILVLILFCLCFVPTNAIANETTDSGSTTSKYVTLHSGSAHFSSYRQHSSVKFLGYNIQVPLFQNFPRITLFALAILAVTFLFIIQTRLKWIKLMPIKYVSRFVNSHPQGTHHIPERGSATHEIHQTRSQHDSQDCQGSKTFLHFHGGNFDRFVYRSVLPGLTIKAFLPLFFGSGRFSYFLQKYDIIAGLTVTKIPYCVPSRYQDKV